MWVLVFFLHEKSPKSLYKSIFPIWYTLIHVKRTKKFKIVFAVAKKIWGLQKTLVGSEISTEQCRCDVYL